VAQRTTTRGKKFSEGITTLTPFNGRKRGIGRKCFNFIIKNNGMVNDIKQDLLNKISSTNDENLLLLLKADYEYFTEDAGRDVTDELSEEDKEELINLVKEPFGYEAISQQELDEAIRQWRTK
jgi:hypothetical protein